MQNLRLDILTWREKAMIAESSPGQKKNSEDRALAFYLIVFAAFLFDQFTERDQMEDFMPFSIWISNRKEIFTLVQEISLF